jgi:hypothetical protein
MAATTFGWRAAVLHREHEPLRRYLHVQRRAACAAGWGWDYGCAGCSTVPSDERLGGCGDGEWEAVSLDVVGAEKDDEAFCMTLA